MEIRAGDRVYIPELSEWDQENYEYGWDYGMDYYMGKEATVEMVSQRGYIYLDIDSGYYCWSQNHLQLITPTNRPRLKVGDNIIVGKPNDIQKNNMDGEWTSDDDDYIGQKYTITHINDVMAYVDDHTAFNECHLHLLLEYNAF